MNTTRSFPVTLMTLFFGFVATANAQYDSSWYQNKGWSGEYPTGFSVVQKAVRVQARAASEKEAPRNVDCALPYLAVFQPWNEARNQKNQAQYTTYAKIVNFTAKENFQFPTDDMGGHLIEIKAGEKIEYLVYGSEGYFLIRYRGEEYYADQSLFEHTLEDLASIEFESDEWLSLRCENGKQAWILLSDLYVYGPDLEPSYVAGIRGVGPGLEGFGSARDLTEKEAAELAAGM